MPNFIEEVIESDLASGRVKKILTRFPPEPNGYLHVGHAKAIWLNYYGTAVKYGGKFNLRFDDTNPCKEEDEFVQSIIEDVKWLGCEINEILYASDYFEKMYECAVILIKKGKAYIDDITPDQMKEMRGTLTEPGKDSPNRNRSVDESLRIFKEMREGKYSDGQYVLRAKIDMASPNINMRDPIIYRILHAHHHRQGNKWCIYPMYDFAHPIEDAVEKITHSICTLEFEDHRPLYDWVISECGLSPAPHQYEFGRLNLKRTIMSKRYLKKLVDTGFVDGWDDPRMPTLAGMRRRGYTPAALMDFCAKTGVVKANSEVDTAFLESCIREELNLTAARAMAVLEPLKLVIVNRPENHNEILHLEINPNNPETGSRQVSSSNEYYIEKSDFMLDPPSKYHRLTPGGTVRLKGGYIIKHCGHEKDESGNVTLIRAEIIEGTKSGEDNSGIKVKGVIHWVNAKDCIDIEAKLYDYLLTDDDSKADFSERLNHNSKIVLKGKGERILEKAAALSVFQFLRTGYFVRDSKSECLVFNRVVGLKDSYKA